MSNSLKHDIKAKSKRKNKWFPIFLLLLFLLIKKYYNIPNTVGIDATRSYDICEYRTFNNKKIDTIIPYTVQYDTRNVSCVLASAKIFMTGTTLF